jgi:hypothetical protein
LGWRFAFLFFYLNIVVIEARFFAALRMTLGESNVPYCAGTKSMTIKMDCDTTDAISIMA